MSLRYVTAAILFAGLVNGAAESLAAPSKVPTCTVTSNDPVDQTLDGCQCLGKCPPNAPGAKAGVCLLGWVEIKGGAPNCLQACQYYLGGVTSVPITDCDWSPY